MKFPKLSMGAKIAVISGTIIITTAIFLPIKIPEKMAMCSAVFQKEHWTTPLGYSLEYIKEKIKCKNKQRERDECERNCIDNGRSVFDCYSGCITIDKPVIYLYPEQTQKTLVQLDYHGELIAEYPEYDEEIGGWSVTANPDGTLINHADDLEYSYLFWEGQPAEKIDWDLSSGFVVKGEDTREFLQDILKKIGLTPKEYNEFIVYWYPLMKDNPYNLIHFAGEKYTDSAPLTITPSPDSLLRVFMVFKPLDEFLEIPEQDFPEFNREGFTVVEWGGTQVK